MVIWSKFREEFSKELITIGKMHLYLQDLKTKTRFQCHLARNDIQGAIHVLRKRNDEPHMLAILRIANLINDTAIINQTLEQILNPVIK